MGESTWKDAPDPGAPRPGPGPDAAETAQSVPDSRPGTEDSASLPASPTVEYASSEPGGAGGAGEPVAAARVPEAGLPEVAGYEVLGVLGRGAAGVVYKA